MTDQNWKKTLSQSLFFNDSQLIPPFKWKEIYFIEEGETQEIMLQLKKI